MKKIFGKLLGGVLMFSLSMSLTSCEDILGHWEKPTPNPITPGGSSSDETTPTMKATPLTLEAITAGTIVVNYPKTGMQYSLNGGAKQAVTTDAITVAIGDKVQFYGNGTSITAYYSNDYTANDTKITGGTAQVKVYGNIMSLVDETGYETVTELTKDYTFAYLFNGNAQLTDISDLQLPAETLTNYCYNSMFQGCTALTAAPAELPATSLANSCYRNMFYGCTSLTTAPALPATTLAKECYASMFNGCTSLTTAYVKAAYNNTNHEYEGMFTGCAADGAVLHTTTASETSWNNNKPGTNWTINPDWND